MIVNNATSGAVISTGLLRESNFNIKMTGKAFKALSDSLYQNKIGSIVRELSCNALDSHKEANRAEIPFEIHLPSVYEPVFYVKDFGMGMAPSMIEQVYTTYFESTKDTSNDSIGGFGLGSKSSFSYATSFNVISVYDGTKYFYSAMIGEDDVPTIALFNEEATDEVNGVTIEMNVKSEDYRRFGQEVIDQLRFFKVKPILLNNTFDYKFLEIVYSEEFEAFKVSSNMSGVWIVQGEVAYKLDKNQFAEKVKDKRNLEFFDLYNNAVMFFNIGDIEVTISREGVSYSTHTIASLEKFINTHAPIIYKNIKEKIEMLPNDWQRLCFLNEDVINRRFAILAGLTFGKTGNTGDKLVTIQNSGASSYFINLTKDWRDATHNIMFHMASFDPAKLTRSYFNGNELIISPKDNIEIFIRDKTKRAIGKIKHYINRNPGSTVYLIEHPEGTDKVTPEWIAKITAYFAGANIKLTTSFPELSKSNLARMGTPVVYMNESTHIRLSSFSGWGRVYDEEELESGYYMTFDKYPYIDATQNELDQVSRVALAKLFDKPIYVIKNTKRALLDDNPNFINAIDKAKEIIEENEKKILGSDTELKRFMLANQVNAKATRAFGGSNHSIVINEVDMHRLPENSSIRYAKRLENISQRYISKINTKVDTQPNLLLKELFKRSLDKKTSESVNVPENIISKLSNDNLYNDYPMLSELGSLSSWGNANQIINRSKLVVDYLLLIDKTRE